jgi:hypothetical protein
VRCATFFVLVLAGATALPVVSNAQIVFSDGTRPMQGPEWAEARKYYENGGAAADVSIQKQNASVVRTFLKAAKTKNYVVMKGLLVKDAEIGVHNGETTPSTVPGGGPSTPVKTYQPLQAEAFGSLIAGCRLKGLLSWYRAYQTTEPKKVDFGLVLTGWRCPRSKNDVQWNLYVRSNRIFAIDDTVVTL